jgi:hypothetical protein
MKEYENDRWRIISTKVGSGFSPAACKDKATELVAIDSGESIGEPRIEGAEDGGPNNNAFEQQVQPGSASTEATPTYA